MQAEMREIIDTDEKKNDLEGHLVFHQKFAAEKCWTVGNQVQPPSRVLKIFWNQQLETGNHT